MPEHYSYLVNLLRDTQQLQTNSRQREPVEVASENQDTDSNSNSLRTPNNPDTIGSEGDEFDSFSPEPGLSAEEDESSASQDSFELVVRRMRLDSPDSTEAEE